MEKLVFIHPKMQYALKEYVRWYYRHFLPVRQYEIFLKIESDKTCIYFSYNLTEEIDNCIRKCKKSRDYDDCLTACHEDVEDSVDEFLCEQVDGFEKLLKMRGVDAELNCVGGYGGREGTIRWMRLCVPLNTETPH